MEMKCEESVQITDIFPTTDSIASTDKETTTESVRTTELLQTIGPVPTTKPFITTEPECFFYQNGSQATPAKEAGFNGTAFIYICVSVIGMICIFLCGLFFLCRWRFFKLYRLPDREISINCSETSDDESKFDSVTLNTTL